MIAVWDAALTVLAGCTAIFGLMSAASRFVPWQTRIVCLVAGLPAGVYAFSRTPLPFAFLGLAFVAAIVVLLAILERPAMERRTATALAQVGRRLRRGRRHVSSATRRVAFRVLTYRRAWAEAVVSVGLSALVEVCESCGSRPSLFTETFGDGETFRVCGSCAVSARRAGGVRSAS